MPPGPSPPQAETTTGAGLKAEEWQDTLHDWDRVSQGKPNCTVSPGVFIFYFGCTWSSLWHSGSLLWLAGISRCGARALGCAGLVALWHGDLSPQPRVKPTSPALEGSFLTCLTPPEKAPEATFEPQICLLPSPCAKRELSNYNFGGGIHLPKPGSPGSYTEPW